MTSYTKTERHPTQPGNRSTGYQTRRRKPKRSLHRFSLFFKWWNYKRLYILIPAGLAVLILLSWLLSPSAKPEGTAAGTAQPTQAETTPEKPQEPYIFRDGDGYPLSVQDMTDAWAAEAGFAKRYNLTDAERLELAQVLTAEAEGEPFAGKVAVAQCILQTCEDEGLSPSEVLVKYSYSKRRPDPTEEALEAVQAVFDFGHIVTSEPIKYFYAPALCQSDWHESQVYVLTINNHKFFAERRTQ
ncbi:spore cortex-lytic protein [Eisenbergiella sp.]